MNIAAGPMSTDDPGLLEPEETSLLIDQYELAMAASYFRRGMNAPAVFELFARHLPPHRRWLLTAGIGPALALVERMRFGERELGYLERLGFDEPFLTYLERFRFSGDVDAIPEGTVAFAREPLARVTGPRIEAQLLETLLLNQVNFQTTIATKAARIVLAAGGGLPDRGGRLIDFSPRRDHGVDAAMKVARCAAIAGAAGTSNVAAAMRYGLEPVGTMAHSYVMSFETEEQAFRAFMEDTPENAVMLVDTYDTLDGVRHAIAASRATGVELKGVRLDSGDLLELSRGARELLDAAGMPGARIVASGDLEEGQIARLVAAGAPIDVWGVGTDLGTSRDAPALGGVYKLVADMPEPGVWRPVAKRSPAKATVPAPKQVFRSYHNGEMSGDVIAAADDLIAGRALMVPVMRAGKRVGGEPLADLAARAAAELSALPERLRLAMDGQEIEPYPVRYSDHLEELRRAALCDRPVPPERSG
jgi:nicotinate phosphoribosyltransferase